jgi:hypothetical protein
LEVEKSERKSRKGKVGKVLDGKSFWFYLFLSSSFSALYVFLESVRWKKVLLLYGVNWEVPKMGCGISTLAGRDDDM